jgi:hypothetical protein
LNDTEPNIDHTALIGSADPAVPIAEWERVRHQRAGRAEILRSSQRMKMC